jgi:hypothetical protein
LLAQREQVAVDDIGMVAVRPCDWPGVVDLDRSLDQLGGFPCGVAYRHDLPLAKKKPVSVSPKS